MHNYSFNNDYRKKAILIIVFISIILNLILYFPLNHIIELICEKSAVFSNFVYQCDNIGLSINQFTVLGLFGIIYSLYSKVLWKSKLFKRFHNIPDLSGEWTGSYSSSFKDENGEPKTGGCAAEIEQSWNKISIKCTFGESSYSYSKTASLYVGDIEGNVLTFTYTNDANIPNWEIKKHDGCNILKYKNGILDGRYFTNRGSGTHGTLTLYKTPAINEEVNSEKITS